MCGESGYFFTPSGIIVLNPPALELYMALSGFFSDVIWGVHEHYRAANGFLCLTPGTRGCFK